MWIIVVLIKYFVKIFLGELFGKINLHIAVFIRMSQIKEIIWETMLHILHRIHPKEEYVQLN